MLKVYPATDFFLLASLRHTMSLPASLLYFAFHFLLIPFFPSTFAYPAPSNSAVQGRGPVHLALTRRSPPRSTVDWNYLGQAADRVRLKHGYAAAAHALNGAVSTPRTRITRASPLLNLDTQDQV